MSEWLTFLTRVHTVLCIVGCLEASLAPMIGVSVEPIALVVTSQPVPRHCQVSPAGKVTPVENHPCET